jgi:putative ABC transport system substrate-binding protein
MAIHIRRSAFISAPLGGAAVPWPLTAWAQRPAKVHRIAGLSAAVPVTEITETSSIRPYRAFFQELRLLGYVEGWHLIVERYSGQGRTEHYAGLARDVVRTKPDVILATAIVWVQHFKPLRPPSRSSA